MSFARFENLLHARIGLNAASIGPSAVERAVRARMRACDCPDADAYWAHLQRLPGEMQALIEDVVVPETWFFRDEQAFKAMVHFVLCEWLPRSLAGTLRLLSIPCSTGEEPYSMAMALLDAGLPPERFAIDGIDVSARVIARAQHGVYGRNSFRTKDGGFRERHFETIDEGVRIRERARASVRFLQGNLVDPGFQAAAPSYDVIFCRNLLIYFDPPTQDRAIAALVRLLAPQGMLFIGHSEAGLMARHGLVSAKIPMAFAFRRPVDKPAQASTPLPPPARLVPAPSTGKDRATPRRGMPRAPTLAERLAPKVVPDDSHETAEIAKLRDMADRGQLAEAEAGCRALLQHQSASSDALLLLGLISDARGNLQEAAGYYRKVLYLDPHQGEAIGHLALLLERQGDMAGAQRLRERMARLDARKAG